MSDDDDAAVFRAAMKGVRPLAGGEQSRTSPRPPVKKPALRKPDDNQQARRQAALGGDEGDAMLVSDYTPVRAPEEYLSWRGPGVQQNLFKQLRTGRMVPEATLDLHGYRLDAASRELPAFIEAAVQRDCRVVRIVHGKGGREDARNAPLKSHVAQWLMQLPWVLAFHSALPTDGGAGAVYVLLRRNKSADEETQ
ncbi:MAG: DNA mismatch repair protein MutS [Gammaproteobacteria bacterium]|nr:MAG: DNA mismatch repair protein MutS [Gammaproteobacteria bacterium]